LNIKKTNLHEKGCVLNDQHTGDADLDKFTIFTHYSSKYSKRAKFFFPEMLLNFDNLSAGNTLNSFHVRDSSLLWEFVRDNVQNKKFTLEIIVPQLGFKRFVLEPESVELINTADENNRYGASKITR
jgi:hypothetical protein